MSFFVLYRDKDGTKMGGSYKSQVYDVKKQDFYQLGIRKMEISMVIARVIKEKLSSPSAGVVLTIFILLYPGKCHQRDYSL